MAITIRPGPDLYRDGNDDERTAWLTRPNPTTRRQEPATGVTGLQAWLATTPGGAALDPVFLVPVTEVPGGGYWWRFEGVHLADPAILPNAVSEVFEVLSNGGDIRVCCRRRVVDIRSL